MGKLSVLLWVTAGILLYGGTCYYVGLKLFRWLGYLFTNLNGGLFAIVYSAIAATLFLSFLPFSGILKQITYWLGSYWMGVFIYFLIFFVVVDFVLIALRLMKVDVTPTIHFFGGLAAVLLTIGFVSYGLYNANQIKHVEYVVEVNEKTISDMKIVLISDVHLGAVNSEQRLEKVVSQINALEPDLICIVGDIFNDNYDAIQNPEQAINTLQKLNATYGVYASLGNHDGGPTLGNMLDFLKRSNIYLLTDDYVVIDDRLVLIGRLDPFPIGGYGGMKRSDISHIFAEIDASLPVVVMDHTPRNLGQYGKEVDLILAGHTHKGQIFPGNLITKRVFEVDYGYYRRDEHSPHVVVTSGVGTWGMPMRVGTHCEIVSIQLRSK